MKGIFVNIDIVTIGALEQHLFELFIQWLEELSNSSN
jgi:hypothetical protein